VIFNIGNGPGKDHCLIQAAKNPGVGKFLSGPETVERPGQFQIYTFSVCVVEVLTRGLPCRFTTPAKTQRLRGDSLWQRTCKLRRLVPGSSLRFFVRVISLCQHERDTTSGNSPGIGSLADQDHIEAINLFAA
jgi:hypothetical protein